MSLSSLAFRSEASSPMGEAFELFCPDPYSLPQGGHGDRQALLARQQWLAAAGFSASIFDLRGVDRSTNVCVRRDG